MRRTLFLDHALLPQGWTSHVRIISEHGLITAIEPGATARTGEDREALGFAGLPNLHSHAFQRAMAGLAERRGPAHDSFWTWREVMYRFLERLDPDDLQAIAAYAFADMLEAGFTSLAEFHYLHHDPSGAPYGDIAELALRHLAAADETGIGVTLLPVLYAHGNFGGAAPDPGQRRFLTAPMLSPGLSKASAAPPRAGRAGPSGSPPTRSGPSHRSSWPPSGTWFRTAPSISTPPNRPARSRTVSPGQASVPWTGCWTMPGSTAAGA